MNLMRSGPTMPNVRVEGETIPEENEDREYGGQEAESKAQTNSYFVSNVADVHSLCHCGGFAHLI